MKSYIIVAALSVLTGGPFRPDFYRGRAPERGGEQ